MAERISSMPVGGRARLSRKLSCVWVLFAVFTLVTADWRDDGLKAHNDLRARHGVPALKLDQELNDFAQQYAEKLASRDTMVHSKGKYGENLYMSGGSKPSKSESATAAAGAWYSEISKYDYDQPGFSSKVGHFTQVVWKGTQKLGIGIAYASSGNIYVVGSYYPPGNYQGQFPENVPKLVGGVRSAMGDKGAGDKSEGSSMMLNIQTRSLLVLPAILTSYVLISRV